MTWALVLSLLGPTQTFEVVPAESVLYVQVFRDLDAAFSGMSHDHVVRAGKISGRIEVDPEAPSACKGRVVVPVAGLIVDEPKWRKQVGYDEMLDEDDRVTVRENMLGPDALDAKRFKEIAFTAEACIGSAEKGVTLAGSMTIRGRSHTLEVPLKAELTGERLRVVGDATLRHADFGMEPLSFFLGAVRNGEEMKLHVELVARRVSPGP